MRTIHSIYRLLLACLAIQGCASIDERSGSTASEEDRSWTPTLSASSRTSERIIGGTQARPGDWPYFASLRLVDKTNLADHFCGGTAIGRRWVLTAAHCFHNRGIIKSDNQRGWDWAPVDGKSMEVVIGAIDLSDGADGTVFTVNDVIIHEKYERTTSTQGAVNDIALVRLSRSWRGPYAKLSAGGASDSDQFASRSFVAGFGWQSDPLIEGISEKFEIAGTARRGKAGSQRLLYAMLPMKTPAECYNKYKDWEFQTQLHICAGYKSGERDSCSGDSGGPLVALDEQKDDDAKRAYQVGIVSYGFGCARKEQQGVYTRVSEFSDWISNRVRDARFVSPDPERALVATTETLRALSSALAAYSKGLSLKVTPQQVQAGEDIRLKIKSETGGRLIIFEHQKQTGQIELIYPNNLLHPERYFIEKDQEVNFPQRFDNFGYQASSGGGTIYAIVLPREVQFVGDLMPTQERMAIDPQYSPTKEKLDYVTRLLDQLGFSTADFTLSSWSAGKLEYNSLPAQETPPSDEE